MSWFNADDKMHSHPKSRAAGLEAMGLWLMAGTYCTDYLTDGAVPMWFVQSWDGEVCAAKLCAVGLWEPTADGNYQFLSWEEYQRTKVQVLKDRAEATERKRAWREEKKREQGGGK